MSSPTGKRLKIAVVFGGTSTEHDISCQSAAGVVQHLDRRRYDVVPVRITRAGVWIVGQPLASDAPALVALTPEPPGPPVTVLGSMAAALAELRAVDVVLPALHGRHGEDGVLQSVLAFAGIPYLGSGVLASAVSLDKQHTKGILAAEGIPVADSVVVRGSGTVAAADRERLGLPVYVKPATGGSSIGVTRVDDWADLDGAIELARRTGGKVLIEAAVPGREVDIGVLERPDGSVVTGPPLEIEVAGPHGFFDYEAKYGGTGSRFVIPAPLDPDVAAALAETAVRVFTVLGCAGLLRVDFFLPVVAGRVVPTVNEVNTLPGLTALSQFPQIWRAAGLDFAQLLDELIDTALARARS
ncbi:MAG: D-alanine--D-alanine ligase family protein [Actinoplanes sp.]